MCHERFWNISRLSVTHDFNSSLLDSFSDVLFYNISAVRKFLKLNLMCFYKDILTWGRKSLFSHDATLSWFSQKLASWMAKMYIFSFFSVKTNLIDQKLAWEPSSAFGIKFSFVNDFRTANGRKNMLCFHSMINVTMCMVPTNSVYILHYFRPNILYRKLPKTAWLFLIF